MMILRERVHLNWEVFNWHGYLGYSYIRIAHPISQEFPKTPPCAVRGWDAHMEGNWAHFSSPLCLAGAGGVYTEKLVVAVVISIPAFFSHSHLNAECYPIIVLSGLAVSPWQQQPLGQWTARRPPTSVLLLFSSWGEFDGAGNHQMSAFSKDASLPSY